MQILIVEDDKIIRENIKMAFKQENYQVLSANSLEACSKILEVSLVNLIILDVNLPDGNGFNFYLNELKNKNIPTIFLTARSSEDDIVYGLDLGASDYLVKPFSIRELLARARRIIGSINIITAKDIKLDQTKNTVYKNKEEIKLTSLEYKIFNLLMINIGHVVTREYILEAIWTWTGNDVNDNTLTVYLKRIRTKLKTDIIKTIKNVGYLIDE
ncbi:MAG: response regulator transcription factor [bacterium]|nr:response regulator transcription factor [bacterium]